MSRAGSFARLRAGGGAPKVEATRRDNVRTAGHDVDGQVEMMLSQGCRKGFSGDLWLMRNEIELGDKSHYLFVKGDKEPRGLCTSINALVSVGVGQNE
ncbi:unnamed protein product [Chondrus crispus]|uniref:Uncharacterized protein n=1 Tax=Chondrus crispus TaxID=2769 RepID=R7QJB3_CHOCR|nr:unnamed protein product [Chondrus crispus]CDF37853.1 unnamed protein product [Chondrus crispus]|eukprot:XP_005717724.1 unnamed protein product [Chondrus crispus]